MASSNPKTEKDPAYYLTLFRLEGHQTWRAHLARRKDGFDHEWNMQQQGEKPKILERQVLKIDCITGGFSQP